MRPAPHPSRSQRREFVAERRELGPERGADLQVGPSPQELEHLISDDLHVALVRHPCQEIQGGSSQSGVLALQAVDHRRLVGLGVLVAQGDEGRLRGWG